MITLLRRFLPLGMLACAGLAVAQPVTLKFASFEPPQAPFTARVFTAWAQDVTQASNGALKIEMYAGGTLGRNPLQQFKLVQDGVADMAWTVPGYTPGRFDDTEVVELPFITRNAAEASLALTRLAARNELVGFADLKLLLIGAVPPVSLHAKTPLKALADLKGKRMRVGSSIGGRIAEALGMTPVIIGAPNTAEAIAKGVVDGTLAEWNFVGTFKIDEVAPHHLAVPLGGTAVMVPMLKSRYDALPPAARAALDRYSGEAFAKRFGEMADALNNGTMERVAKQPRNTVTRADAATAEEFRKAVDGVTAAWRAQKPRNEHVYKVLQAELARIRGGK
ncbi:MAG: TRAP transporter substrate-binding protein [Burkholderiales bacterium]|nr:TRAP transporter substrate-binding protein [Burkholderiales bacterium]